MSRPGLSDATNRNIVLTDEGRRFFLSIHDGFIQTRREVERASRKTKNKPLNVGSCPPLEWPRRCLSTPAGIDIVVRGFRQGAPSSGRRRRHARNGIQPAHGKQRAIEFFTEP